MRSTHKVVVLDDDAGIAEVVGRAAGAMGMECVYTTDPKTFLRALTPETSMIFLDLIMPELDGVEILRCLSWRQEKAPIILMSGAGKRILESVQRLSETLGLSIAGHLEKPFRLGALEAALKRCDQVSPVQQKLAPSPLIITEKELRRGLAAEEFEVYYQPQISIASGHVTGMEALVRWEHPQHGLVFPDQFIPLAEETRLIDALGWFVAVQGLSDLMRFARACSRPLTLSLNISAVSLCDIAFPDRLMALVRESRIEPERVTLEVTESGMIQELSSALDSLSRTRMKGMQISIDDFGTGYSMIKQLQNMPATEIKIDKSFVQNIRSDSDRVLVQKTIEIGKALGMRVIAEGVETEEQFDFVRGHECDTVQGFLFSKALPADAMMEWLQRFQPALLAA